MSYWPLEAAKGAEVERTYNLLWQRATLRSARAERWRRREASGDMIIVRYADDIIVVRD